MKDGIFESIQDIKNSASAFRQHYKITDSDDFSIIIDDPHSLFNFNVFCFFVYHSKNIISRSWNVHLLFPNKYKIVIDSYDAYTTWILYNNNTNRIAIDDARYYYKSSRAYSFTNYKNLYNKHIKFVKTVLEYL